jgi:hypothetical protein
MRRHPSQSPRSKSNEAPKIIHINQHLGLFTAAEKCRDGKPRGIEFIDPALSNIKS